MGFERNYQVKILSKQINKSIRLYSTYAIRQYELEQNKANISWFFTGLIDGEGCFTIGISRDKKNKVGWAVKLIFKMKRIFTFLICMINLMAVKDIEFLLIVLFTLIGGIFWISCLDDPFLLCAIIPIKIYPNAEADKAKIFKENKNKSGIYMWINRNNGKEYIGSAMNLSERLSFYYSFKAMENYLKKNKSYIYNAILKQGHSNFSLIIIEYCDKEKCLKREGYYQQTLNPEYNLAKEPGAPMSGRKHLEETKTIMSEAKKGENNYNFGRTFSDETKQIMSDVAKKNWSFWSF
jgi:hypothetical protein